MKSKHTPANLTMAGAGPVALTLLLSAALGLSMFDGSDQPLLPIEGDCTTTPP